MHILCLVIIDVMVIIVILLHYVISFLYSIQVDNNTALHFACIKINSEEIALALLSTPNIDVTIRNKVRRILL